MNDPLIIDAGMSDITVDLTGPALSVETAAPALAVDLPEAPITATFAAVGIPGVDGFGGRIEAVAAAAMPAGTPVTIDRASGRFVAAAANWKPMAFVAGLIEAESETGFGISAVLAELTLTSWAAITGTAQLLPGLPYFLGPAGGLTATPPRAPNCLVLVGTALNPATLLITPQPPIQL